MKSSPKFLKLILSAIVVLVASGPSSLFACATCFGKSDSSLAQGMNWGIFTLLGVVVTVLASIGGFFIYIIRRETAMTNNPTPQDPTEV